LKERGEKVDVLGGRKRKEVLGWGAGLEVVLEEGVNDFGGWIQLEKAPPKRRLFNPFLTPF
jgi:hypothetical protein